VLDERGEVLLEQRLGTTSKTMKEVFGGMPSSRIALRGAQKTPAGHLSDFKLAARGVSRNFQSPNLVSDQT